MAAEHLLRMIWSIMLACAGAARPAITAAASNDAVLRGREENGIDVSYQN
jgi:hypothetical protein